MYSLTRLTFLLALVTFQLSAGVATLDERVSTVVLGTQFCKRQQPLRLQCPLACQPYPSS